MNFVNFRGGSVIFREGERGEAMYCIMEGKVAIYADYEEKSRKLLTELGVGRYFGEMAIIDSLPRSATAVAVEDCMLMEVKKENMTEFTRTNPAACTEMMRNLSRRLRAVTDDYMDACKTISDTLDAGEKPAKKDLTEKLNHFAKAYREK